MAPPEADGPAQVSRESFERALREQDTPYIRNIGKRLAWRQVLLEKAMRDLHSERGVLREENARLHQSIAATIRELTRHGSPGGHPDSPVGEDAGDLMAGLWQWMAEPCTVVEEAPEELTVLEDARPGRALQTPEGRLVGSTARNWAGADKPRLSTQGSIPMARGVSEQLPRDASLGSGGDSPSLLDDLPGGLGRAAGGLAAFGKYVSQQFSEVLNVFSEGGDPIFSGTCGKKGNCCAAQGSPPPVPCSVSLDIEMHAGGRGAKEAEDKFSAVKAAGAGSPTSAGANRMFAAAHRKGMEASAAAAQEPHPRQGQQRGQEEARAPTSCTVLIEARLHLGGLDVAACRVCATDRCLEVAARFVAEHSLKPSFEAPLAAYLMKAEADADRFPVHLRADLMEIRAKHAAGML